jgi:hypothetical protein
MSNIFPRDDNTNAVCMLLQYVKQVVLVMQGDLTHQLEKSFLTNTSGDFFAYSCFLSLRGEKPG